MTFLGRLLKSIGHFFKGLFNEARKAYNHLSTDQKAALLHGAGVVDLINTNLDKTPAELRDLIKNKFPDIDEAKLEDVIFQLTTSFKLLPENIKSFDDCIVALQGYFKGLSGKEWAWASHSAGSLISILFAPKETKFAAIASLIEYVYQHLVKK